MKTLDRYLLRYFIPVFLSGILVFVFLIQLIDLFTNLWRYLACDASIWNILKASLYYVPKCISYSLPISLLFAVAYVLGDLYARNELIVVFSSGISLRRLSLVFLVFGFSISVISFFFEDRVVLETLQKKIQLTNVLTRKEEKPNDTNVVVKAQSGRLLYAVDFFNKADNSLNGLTVVERDKDGHFLSLIRAKTAAWNGSSWVLSGAYCYEWVSGELKTVTYTEKQKYNESPDTFMRNTQAVEALRIRDAKKYIEDLERAGLPYAAPLSDYYRRFAFAATSFVVIILSIAMGGRFRKNILLMSLLSSLFAAVVYYVSQMISMMLAKLGYIPPVVGAWFPAFLFILFSVLMIMKART